MTMKTWQLAALALLGLAVWADSTTAGDGWPAPPDKWWEIYPDGARADDEPPLAQGFYEMRMGNTTMRLVISVKQRVGSEITFLNETFLGDEPLPAEPRTEDVADPKWGLEAFPDGSTVTRNGDPTTIQVGELPLSCIPYEVTVQVKGKAMSMTCWHSPRLPPIFSGGNVKLHTTAGGEATSIVLTEFRGELLGEAEHGEEPGGGDDDGERGETPEDG